MSHNDLYRMVELVPLHLRASFEAGLGTVRASYRTEVERRGQEPSVQPIPDILALYLDLGFVSTPKLLDGYQRAHQLGHQTPFLAELERRNTKAIGLSPRHGQRGSYARNGGPGTTAVKGALADAERDGLTVSVSGDCPTE